MTVTLPDGQARGFVGELMESPTFSPQSGPHRLERPCLARHFLVPTAVFEDRAARAMKSSPSLGAISCSQHGVLTI